MGIKSNRKWRFWAKEEGSVTVEFVLWLPMIFVVILMAADVSVLLFNRSNTVRLIEDAHRLRSVGQLTSEDATTDYIVANLGRLYSGSATVVTVEQAGVVTTTVTLPSSNMDVVGTFATITGDPSIAISSEQYIENWEA